MRTRGFVRSAFRLAYLFEVTCLIAGSRCKRTTRTGGFDLPVIRYRAMLHGVAAPEFYRLDGEWKWNNYQNRFHDMHVDLMDVLSGYGASMRIGHTTPAISAVKTRRSAQVVDQVDLLLQ